MIEKIKNRLKQSNCAYLAWAFIIPTLVMWLIYIAMEVFPFGNNSVLVLDLNAQYVYFFENLRDILNGTASLLYSWRRALGGEFMGMFAYYLASPLSFIVALFPENAITEALLCLFLLKTGLCGLTSGYYLQKTHPTKRISVVIFSTLYALSSYAVVMQHNTMWIDALILLPLVMLGVESLIKDGKFKLYVTTLALTMLANYYIGYMVCIFIFVYFFYYYITYGSVSGTIVNEKRHFLKSFIRIGCFSVIGILIAMVIILPAYYSLTFGKTTFSNPSYDFKQKFDFLDFLSKLYIGSYDTVRPAGLPFIYCGMLSAIFLPLYFVTKKVNFREKVMGGLLLTFFIVSFNSTTIDLVWHGFQKPNWLNYRYSFIFIFMIIVFAYRAFEYLEEIDYKYILGSASLLVLLLVIIQKQDYEYIDDLRCVWISFGFIGAYIVALYSLKHKLVGNSSALILAIIVITETFSAGLLNVTDLDSDVVYSSRTSYLTAKNKYQPLVDYVKELDDSFYRMDKNVHRKTNDAMALGINGITSSTSTLNASVIELLSSLGYSARSHWSKYYGGTPVSDSLLGIKYLIYDNSENFGVYEDIYDDTANELYTFKNPYALSIAYAADKAIADLDISEYASPFEVMNWIVTALLGSNEQIQVFKPLEILKTTYNHMNVSIVSGHKKYTPESTAENCSLNYRLMTDEDCHLFYFIPASWQREVEVSVNGEAKGKFFENDNYRVTYIGEYAADTDIFVTLVPQKDEIYASSDDYFFYTLDLDVLDEVMNKLAEGNFIISEYSDTKLIGTVNVASGNEMLFTSIPYDEGWHVYIDNVEMPLIKTLDSLLAVEISEGEHDVKFVYMPKCFVIGAALSIIGIIIFCIAIIIEYFVTRRRRKATPVLCGVISDDELFESAEKSEIDNSYLLDIIDEADTSPSDNNGNP